MKLFKPSTKTLSEAELFQQASTLVLSHLLNKTGYAFSDETAKLQIQRLYAILKEAAEV